MISRDAMHNGVRKWKRWGQTIIYQDKRFSKSVIETRFPYVNESTEKDDLLLSTNVVAHRPKEGQFRPCWRSSHSEASRTMSGGDGNSSDDWVW